MPSSPSHASNHQHHLRPASQALSWLSGRSSGHGRVPSDHPSVSSLGSSQGGLHAMYNQALPHQQGLNTVSEMDGVEIERPMELDGSSAPPVALGSDRTGTGHVYGSGYRHVATTDRREA